MGAWKLQPSSGRFAASLEIPCGGDDTLWTGHSGRAAGFEVFGKVRSEERGFGLAGRWTGWGRWR